MATEAITKPGGDGACEARQDRCRLVPDEGDRQVARRADSGRGPVRNSRGGPSSPWKAGLAGGRRSDHFPWRRSGAISSPARAARRTPPSTPGHCADRAWSACTHYSPHGHGARRRLTDYTQSRIVTVGASPATAPFPPGHPRPAPRMHVGTFATEAGVGPKRALFL